MTPIHAAAEALFVSEKTLRRWVALGAPHKRVGAGPRAPLVFDLDALRAWCAANDYTGQRGRPPLEVTLMREAARVSKDELRQLAAMASRRIAELERQRRARR